MSTNRINTARTVQPAPLPPHSTHSRALYYCCTHLVVVRELAPGAHMPPTKSKGLGKGLQVQLGYTGTRCMLRSWATHTHTLSSRLQISRGRSNGQWSSVWCLRKWQVNGARSFLVIRAVQSGSSPRGRGSCFVPPPPAGCPGDRKAGMGSP